MRIPEKFNEKKTVFSLEIFPPKKTSAIATIYDTIEELAELTPDFISVTYGAGGNVMDKSTGEIAARIKNDHGIEPLAHLTCVNSTREQVGFTLGQLYSSGIENIMALRGDINPDVPVKEDFRHANELVTAIKSLSDMSVMGACYPEGHYEAESIEKDIENLKYKLEAGVQGLVTQLFFDNDKFYDFMGKVRKTGITVPVSAGIMPIVNARLIQKTVTLSGCSLPHDFSSMISKYENDPEALYEGGIDYATRQIRDLIENGTQGIHLYTMNNPRVAKSIYANIKDLL